MDRLPKGQRPGNKPAQGDADAPADCVPMGDWESDIDELFCTAADLQTHFLVRTCVDRLLFRNLRGESPPVRGAFRQCNKGRCLATVSVRTRQHMGRGKCGVRNGLRSAGRSRIGPDARLARNRGLRAVSAANRMKIYHTIFQRLRPVLLAGET